MRQYFPRLWYDPYHLHVRGLGLCLSVFTKFIMCSAWAILCYWADGGVKHLNVGLDRG